jgi:hypothetical protein
MTFRHRGLNSRRPNTRQLPSRLRFSKKTALLLDGRALIHSQKSSRHPNMKELRIQYLGNPYRICIAFDPRQRGSPPIGGIKSGKNWTPQMVAAAGKIYDAYLAQLRKEGLL